MLVLPTYSLLSLCGFLDSLTGSINMAHITKGFLLHTDKHGCLVPGCHLIDKTINQNEQDVLPFKIHPNPVKGQLYILSRISSNEKHIIKIYDMNGVEIFRSLIDPVESDQYIVTLPSDINSGIHVLLIENSEGKKVFTQTIVVQ